MLVDRNGLQAPPAGTWQQDWFLRASPWPNQPLTGPDLVLRTLAGLGDLAIDEFPPSWSFHLGIPATFGLVNVCLLSNGVLISFPGIAPDARVDTLMVDRDLLVGETSLDIAPILFTPENIITDDGDLSTLSTDRHSVALRTSSQGGLTRYSLAICEEGLDAALAKSKAGLTLDVTSLVQHELHRRVSYWEMHHEPGRDQSVQTSALEQLAFGLEATTQGIPYSFSTSPRVMDSNITYPLVRCWNDIDADVARSILMMVLAAQSEDGALPSRIDQEQGPQFDHAPWPLFVATAHLIRRTDASFIQQIIPALQKYLTWAILYFDPKSSGRVFWRCAEESLIPDTYDDNVVSAGLAALLLREIDMFFELYHFVADDHTTELAHLSSARKKIENHLIGAMWDQQVGVFRDHYDDGTPINRTTFSGVLPLLWDKLPNRFAKPLLNILQDGRELGDWDGIPLWQSWENDPELPPILPAQQTLMLDTLMKMDQKFAFTLASRIVHRISTHYTATHLFPSDLQTNGQSSNVSTDKPSSSVASACLAMLSFAATHRRYANAPTSRIALTMEKHLKATTIGLTIFVMLVLGGFAIYHRQPYVPLESSIAKSELTIANQILSQGEYAKALNFSELLEGTVDDHDLRFFQAQVQFEQKKYGEAEATYRKLLDSDSDSDSDSGNKIKTHMNVALCLFQQNRFEEAAREYGQIIATFDKEDPTILSYAKVARNILLENQETLEKAHPLTIMPMSEDDEVLEQN